MRYAAEFDPEADVHHVSDRFQEGLTFATGIHAKPFSASHQPPLRVPMRLFRDRSGAF